MKFKVYYGMTPNLFGKLGSRITLISDDKTAPYSINWFLNKVIKLFDMENEDKEKIKSQKKHLLESFQKLEIGVACHIVNKEDQTVAFIERVDDSTTLQDLLTEYYGL